MLPLQLLGEDPRRGVAVEDVPIVEHDDRERQVVDDGVEQRARQDLADHFGALTILRSSRREEPPGR